MNLAIVGFVEFGSEFVNLVALLHGDGAPTVALLSEVLHVLAEFLALLLKFECTFVEVVRLAYELPQENVVTHPRPSIERDHRSLTPFDRRSLTCPCRQ